MLLISRNKTKKQGKETKRQKQGSKRKQEETKKLERDREREHEKGGGKKASEKQRETLQNKPKCPF